MSQRFFNQSRLMVSAIKNRVISVFGSIEKLMGDDFCDHSLCFMIFIIGQYDLELFPFR
ncbi:Uncharacterised protein [Vibrio cholerae]|nr:Uncharacterised protein [Vibrio cholerae]